MKKGYLALVAAALALLASTAVRADVPVEIPVQLQYLGYVPYYTAVDIYSLTPDVDPNGNHIYENVVAGNYNHNVPFGTPFIDSGNQRLFCMDLVQHPEDLVGAAPYVLTQVEYAPQPDGGVATGGTPGANGYPMGTVRADWLAVLANQYWTTGWLEGPEGAPLSEAQRDINYAALQVAIWEIIYEGVDADDVPSDWSVSYIAPTTGNPNPENDFYIASDATVRGVADTMLNWCEANFASATRANLGALVSDEFQDMLVRTNERVPEPSALALAGLGLLGFFTRRRKRS
jgi:hypothetical protein